MDSAAKGTAGSPFHRDRKAASASRERRATMPNPGTARASAMELMSSKYQKTTTRKDKTVVATMMVVFIRLEKMLSASFGVGVLRRVLTYSKPVPAGKKSCDAKSQHGGEMPGGRRASLRKDRICPDFRAARGLCRRFESRDPEGRAGIAYTPAIAVENQEQRLDESVCQNSQKGAFHCPKVALVLASSQQQRRISHPAPAKNDG